MDLPPSKYLRVNTLKITPDDLIALLARRGFILEPTELREVFRVVKEPMSAGATIEYMIGLYYIQDLSSCMAVEALEPRPGERVLDIAAAPGGKTSDIAQRMENTGAIISIEPNEKRARSLSFNLERMGIMNTCICNMSGKDVVTLRNQFDRVLLDAPCSCEGIIAKDARRKTSHTPQDVEYCSNRQLELVSAAASVVRPGGTLVYSTCSFAPEENEMIIDSLIKNHKRKITVVPSDFGSPGLTEFGEIHFDSSLKNARRLYPHLHDTTGFFIAKLGVS